MATDLTGIYNLALSVVGTKAKVALPTEVSREAEVCQLWYEATRDRVLRAAPWPCTRKVVTLGLVAERDFSTAWSSGDPEPPWKYAYAYPSDMLAPRHLTDFSRFATGLTDDSRTILTDTAQASLVYTKRQTNIAAWDSDLLMAVAHALAGFIAMPLHGKVDRARNAIELANQYILDARVNAANQDYEPMETLPPWLVARGYGQVSTQRFLYPYGETLSLTTSTSQGSTS